MVVRRVRRAELPWLVLQGLLPEHVGRRYHWAETPLQLLVAPARAALAVRGPAAAIEVDGRRAGYIGRNPLSGNLEYWVAPWARGGVGRLAIAAFLRDHRAGDRSRAFFVSHKNAASRGALLRAFDDLGWREGDDFTVTGGRMGERFVVRAER